MPRARKKKALPVLDARPDTLDFRDVMYTPTLVEVPTTVDIEEYRRIKVPILDQGQEGACTGFGLATVVHYLLATRKVVPNRDRVSPHMLYDLARRYDEWPGEKYSGSSARGAMKGWQKHGVCALECWTDKARTPDRWENARRRPLGAYFRVNHRDLVAMHSAIAEARVLFATATVHAGWESVRKDGEIPYDDTGKTLGGHAFAVVAYDANGFWIQNSWGEEWGAGGFAQISYDDWLANGTDVWVARLGAPVTLLSARSTSTGFADASKASRSYVYGDLRPHIVSIGNDGAFRAGGSFGVREGDVEEIFTEDFPRITSGWEKKRIVLYAHGGLVSEDSAVQRVADYRAQFLEKEIYPLAFIWKTDFWTTITNVLRDALRRRRPEGFISGAKDFMLDRLDDALEPLARLLTGRASWNEMKENALAATARKDGGVRRTLDLLARHLSADVEIHVLAHSAGAVLHAPLVPYLTGKLDRRIKTCTLWAPSCTMALFHESYAPAIKNGRIGEFALFTLTDRAENDDDCANIYHKSLLFLVSHAFEDRFRIPPFTGGEPLLGMDRYVRDDRELKKLIASGKVDWVLSPNAEPEGSRGASRANQHGAFDDDNAAVNSVLTRITGKGERSRAPTKFTFRRSASKQRDIRRELTGQADNVTG